MTQPDIQACAELISETVGRPWAARGTGPEAYDCWGLAQRVQRDLFDRCLPDAGAFVAEGQGLRDVIETIKASELQRRWQAVARPSPGDIVLMARSAQFSHVGTWVDGGPGLRGCLHCVRGDGVLLQGMAELRVDWARMEFRRCVEPALVALAHAPLTRLSHVAARPVLVVVNDPLNPLQSADIRELQPGITAREAVAALPDLAHRWLCLNDMPLLRVNPATGEDEWSRRVGPRDVLWALPPMPEGDDRSSQVLATVLTIAATVAAPYAAAALGGGAFGTASALTGTGKLLSAGIAVGANLLISSFIRPPSQGAVQLANSDPTYAFGNIGNQMRPGGVVPRIYGTMRRQPDLLAAPWAQYEENKQLIHILLCLGQGEYDLLEFGIGDTAVWTKDAGLTGAIADCEFEIVPPGGQVTLFPAAVEVNTEVDGIELAAPDPDPDAPTNTVGPYVAVPAGETARELVLDFAFPYGLFDISGTTMPASVSWVVEAQLIDDLGQPAGFLQELESFTETAETTSTLRLTKRLAVPAGRYRVQVTRTTASALSGAGKDTLVWAGLKSNLAAETVYDDVTALALRVRADATSSGSLQQWYAKATAILPYYDAAGDLVTGPTEAIEAAALDILRSDYGLARSDDQIDIDQLQDYAATWAARGDVCCTAIESEMGAWDALSLVLAAGRTKPQFLGGMVTFVRDEARAAAPRLITDADMLRGSFSVERLHARQDSPNAVNMRYRDRDGVMRSLLCAPSGITEIRAADQFTQVMVDAAQVWREGHYMAASNNVRRRFLSWVMLGGGRALIPGKLVDIAHPRPKYGSPARVMDMDWPILTLSAPSGLARGEAGWVALAMPDGALWGPVRCLGLSSTPPSIRIDDDDLDTIVTQPQDHDYAPNPRDWIVTGRDHAPSSSGPDLLRDTQSEATRVVVGRDGEDRIRAIVLETIPRDAGQVEVLAVEEVASVHSADQVALPVTALPEALTNTTAPSWQNVVITGQAVADPQRPDRVDFTVSGPDIPGAVRYLAETASQLSAPNWADAGGSSVPEFDGPSLDGEDVYIRVAAAGPVLRGPWSYFRTQLSIIAAGRTVAVPVDPPEGA